MSKHIEEYLIPDVIGSLQRIEAALAPADPARPGEVSFAKANLQPPAQFYLTQGMRIRLRTWSAMTNETLTMTAVFLVDNRIVPITLSTPTFTASQNVTVMQPEVTGFLISCGLTCAVASQRGQTFSVIEVLDQTGNYLYTLLSDYVTAFESVAYPPIRIEKGFSGNGWWTQNNGTRVSNSWYLFTCNAPRVQIVHSVNFEYITDATLGNRYVEFSLTNPIGDNYRKRLSFPLLPSSTYVISFSTEGSDTPLAFVPAAWLHLTCSIPRLACQGAGNFSINVFGFGATDDFNLVNSQVEQFYGY